MRLNVPCVAVALAATLMISRGASAQDGQPPPGVRLGLSYAVGTKPGILVLPLEGDSDDSVRTIIQRDLDYGDRVAVVALDAASARGMLPAPGKQFNFPMFA